MTVTRLTDHLDRIEVDGFQVYLWCDDDGVTLIDSGPLGSGPAILDALHARGRAPEDLRRIVLTHFHDDHTGSAAELRARTSDRPGRRCARPPRRLTSRVRGYVVMLV